MSTPPIIIECINIYYHCISIQSKKLLIFCKLFAKYINNIALYMYYIQNIAIYLQIIQIKAKCYINIKYGNVKHKI